ncbi:FkbM family methyltransferase [archaeon]|nr:FkbM family methyltransferase [archaeon]
MNKYTTLKLPFGKKQFKIYGNDDDVSSFIPLQINGTYEPGTMRVLKKIIKPTDICIDIGGNIGMISIPLGFLAKRGHVYAFEPESNNYQNFMDSIAENKSYNVEVFCCGISDNREVRTLTYEMDKLACNHMTDTNFVNPECETKDALFITLDEFIIERSLDTINFIKIDVEGAEVKILRAIKQSILKFKPTLIVEVAPSLLHTYFNNSPKDLWEVVFDVYKYIYWIDDNSGYLTRLNVYSELESKILKSKGWDNILCSNKEVK